MSEQRNKVAVVTGGSRGIGKAIAERFLRDGYRVVVISNSGVEVTGAATYKCNVADFEQVGATAQKIITDLGGVDVLVNNAGITRDNLALRMSEAEFDEVISVNLKGVFNCCKHFMRAIMRSGNGRIINISSISGIAGTAGQANYAASKAGVIAMTKVLARELGGKGVTVNAIAPGFIDTDMTAGLDESLKEQVLKTLTIKRFGVVNDIAAAAAFLAGSESGYITGQTLVIDGGLTL